MLNPARLICVPLLVAALSIPIAAMVDPNFTPLDVHRQSGVIAVLAVPKTPNDTRSIAFTIDELIKGKLASRQITLDLTAALAEKDGPAAVKALLTTVNESAGRKAIAFLPEADFGKGGVLFHIGGQWLRATATQVPDTFTLVSADTRLNGTFNGATDMLIETMRFISKYPDRPIMPIDARVKWDAEAHTKVGSLPAGAAAAGLTVLDVNGDGKPDIYAASPGGDRVFLADKDMAFTELAGLKSASTSGAWADFDNDGRPDLASLSAAGLTLHLQKSPGNFQAQPVELPGKVTHASPSLYAADFDADGRADLVVRTGLMPLVLRNSGPGKFQTVELKPDGKQADDLGLPGPVAVADFDNDGRMDIVAAFQKDSLLFRGLAEGAFAAGTACGAAMGPAKERNVVLADLAGCGRPQLLFVGGGVRFIAYTWKDGRFEPISQSLGEASYIIQTGASCLAAGDFNNDTFLDLFVGYTKEPGQFFFNRGFRSFAICEPMKLPPEDIPSADKGQTAATWADLDGDGSAELVTALADGTVWASMTDLGAMTQPLAVKVKLGPKCPTAGPVAVSFWVDELCLGSRVIPGRFSTAMLGLPQVSMVTLKWRLPGGAESSAKVKVADGVETCVIEQ